MPPQSGKTLLFGTKIQPVFVYHYDMYLWPLTLTSVTETLWNSPSNVGFNFSLPRQNLRFLLNRYQKSIFQPQLWNGDSSRDCKVTKSGHRTPENKPHPSHLFPNLPKFLLLVKSARSCSGWELQWWFMEHTHTHTHKHTYITHTCISKYHTCISKYHTYTWLHAQKHTRVHTHMHSHIHMHIDVQFQETCG